MRIPVYAMLYPLREEILGRFRKHDIFNYNDILLCDLDISFCYARQCPMF